MITILPIAAHHPTTTTTTTTPARDPETSYISWQKITICQKIDCGDCLGGVVRTTTGQREGCELGQGRAWGQEVLVYQYEKCLKG